VTHLRRLMWALEHCRPELRQKVFASMSASDQRALEDLWAWQARAAQDEPEGDWRTWLIMAGRGWGKTRTGAEWVLAKARVTSNARIALIGASLDEAARVMVEGESGLIACAPPGERIEWQPSKGELRLPGGAVAQIYSGASPDGLRGPQHHFAWADELAKWRRAEAAWAMLQMGLRLGDFPRAVVTTTPSSIRLLRDLANDPSTEVRRGRTFDNPHLSPAFLGAMQDRYAGTRLGRQELDGELLDEAEGALWTRDVIEACRRAPPGPGELARVVVGVDPPGGDSGNACGIVVCARLQDGHAAVLADCSLGGVRPEAWARAVAAAATAWQVDRVVAEANQGGLMVEDVLRGAAPDLPLRLVHASRGKAARAEPVSALFEARRCWLAGVFPELEDEMAAMTPAGYRGSGSPDRLDAMVWALTWLMLKSPAEPLVRVL
jgi:phage terminase large subunit-like protein